MSALLSSVEDNIDFTIVSITIFHSCAEKKTPVGQTGVYTAKKLITL
jgi:hypothetical protein